MNTFQRSAILVLRLCGVAMLIIAVMGLLHFGFDLIIGRNDSTATSRAEAGVLWLLFGGGLVLTSRLLGKWLGQDLD